MKGVRRTALVHRTNGFGSPPRFVHVAEEDRGSFQAQLMRLGLRLQGATDSVAQLRFIAWVITQDFAQIQGILSSQAKQQPTISGYTYPVAVAAEVMAVRRDESYPGLRPWNTIVTGRSTRGLGGGNKLEFGLEVGAYFIIGIKGLHPIMITDPTERHLLDEADVDSLVHGELDQIPRLVVVPVFEDDAVELDALEPRRAGRVDSAQDPVEIPVSGYEAKALWSQAVEADVDAPHARGPDLHGQLLEPGPIGGDHQLAELGEGRNLSHEPKDVAAYERLTPSQADLANTHDHEGPGDLGNLRKTQHLVPRCEALAGLHAVDATEVAPVRDRDAQIGDGAAETVYQAGRRRLLSLSDHCS